MITLQKITKKLPGGRILFEDVEISFNPGHRYGLTGPNGSGKSTLMKILMKEEEPSSGKVITPKKVGFLRQDLEPYLDYSVRDVVLMGNERLWAVMQERERLYEVEMTDEIGMRLAEIEEIIAEEDGYVADSEAEELLAGLGIEKEAFDGPLRNVATDNQFRVLLCQAIFGHPEALLLDEPTNHLDLESIGWLENFLETYPGVLIVTSHDRHFLNAITTDIADIDYETIILYPGNYDAMLVAKTSMRAREEHEEKSKAKKVAQLRDFISKFSAGTRASQVQSRAKEISRLEPKELKKSNIERPFIQFEPPEKPSGKSVMRVEKLKKGFEHTLFERLSFDIERGDKIGIIGNNGCGKTTLMRTLIGELTPDTGTIEMGHGVSVGYFPQEHTEVIEKSESITAFDWLKAARPGLYDEDIRGALGKVLFSGQDAFKPLSALSGGETARLILAGLMLKNANTLFLDEPNNHLDLESVSALAQSLKRCEQTVFVIAHDRDLVSQVANKLIIFEGGSARFYHGTYDDYLASRANSAASR